MASKQPQGQTVAFLTAQEGIQEIELTEPWKAVQEAGGTPKLIAPESGEIQAFNHRHP
jgi:protease I